VRVGETAATIARNAADALNATRPANVVAGGVTVNGDRITVEFDTAANAATALPTTTLGGVTMTVGVVQDESIIGFEVVNKNDGKAVSNIEINLATLEARVGAGNVNLDHITDILNGGLNAPGNLVAISSQYPPNLGGVPGSFGGPGLAGVEASITNGRFQIRGHSNDYQVQVREDSASGTQIFPSSAVFSAFDPPVPNVAATSVVGVASTVSNITSSGTALTATTIINPAATGGFVAGEVLRLQVNDRNANTTVSTIEIDLQALQDAGGGVNGLTLETLIETINGYPPTATGGASIISSQFPAAVPGTPAGRSGGPGLFGAKAVLENGQMRLISASDRYDFVVDANAVAPKNPDLILTANNPTTPPTISFLSPRNGNVGYFFGLNDFLVSEMEDSPQSSAAELINVRSDLRGNVPAISHGAIVARNVGSNPTASFTVDAGDGSAINAMVDAVSGTIQIGDDTFRSAISFAGDTTSNIALATITNNNALQYQADIVESTRTQLASEVGVNRDEELGNLVAFQNAYSASAKVVTAVQEMFDVIANMVR
jgi:flagellar hook-associated protein FlgK